MELGAEISQKIRSAIKAKLVDLGAYVDDELPDYIMVMVANKKNVAQMTADLNLFLGNNTDKFTTWLSGLLNKLQAVTTENEKKNEAATAVQPETSNPSEPVLQINAELDEKIEATGESEKKERPRESVKPTMKSVSSKPSSREVSSRLGRTSSSSSSHSHSGHRTSSSSSSSSRKRKLPTSAVVSKVTREGSEEEEEEEEEYDPLNPAVGKVASVIRVTERKSSIPVTKQANKSLLMRAMKDAECSVSRVKVVRPMRKESSGRSDSRQYENVVEEEEIIERRTITAQPKSRPIQLFSRSKREQMKRHLAAAAASAATEEEDVDEPRHKVKIIAKPQPQVSCVEDVRVPVCVPERVPVCVAERVAVEEPGMEKVVQQPQHEEEEEEEEFELVMEPDGLDWQLEEDEEVQHSLRGLVSPPTERPAASPKFVVTLDGVDADNLDLEEVEVEEEERRNIVRVQPMRPVQPVMVRLEEEDADSVDEGEENPPEVDAKKAQTTEKCRFFPNCKNGDDCPYSHPTTPCTNFPNCRFGEKCLYVHPKCKFDATCNRPNCAYTHTVKRPAGQFPGVAAPVPVLMPVPMYPPPRPPPSRDSLVCRFYPRCTNVNCTFTHPKPCRFGLSCSRKSTCAFSHPALPGKDKLRWSAASATAGPKAVPVSPSSPVSPASSVTANSSITP